MNKVRAILILLILLNMGYIFYNSAATSQASNSTSRGVALTIAPAVVRNFGNKPEPEKDDIVTAVNDLIRECAHSFEFAVLGFLTMLLMKTIPTIRKTEFSLFLKLLFTVLFCFMYALSDEFHQLFVDGRSCELFDIAADTLGSIVGALVAMTLRKKHTETVEQHGR